MLLSQSAVIVCEDCPGRRQLVVETDAALMELLRRRESWALAVLYDRHSSLVFATCTRMLGDRVEAEDVLLEVFTELWDRADRFNASRGSVLGYILCVTRSRLLDQIRRRKCRRKGELNFYTDTRGHLLLASADPLAFAISSENASEVSRAMGQLNEKQRLSIEMAFFEAMTYAEIAAALGEPLATVKSRIRSALTVLRSTLAEGQGVRIKAFKTYPRRLHARRQN